MLLAAAISGILLGANDLAETTQRQALQLQDDVQQLDAEAGNKHACKGQNECKGQGGCKTEKHGCKGQNACKGQGGCRTDGKKADKNGCGGKSGCGAK